jgi:hypothetical protein
MDGQAGVVLLAHLVRVGRQLLSFVEMWTLKGPVAGLMVAAVHVALDSCWIAAAAPYMSTHADVKRTGI